MKSGGFRRNFGQAGAPARRASRESPAAVARDPAGGLGADLLGQLRHRETFTARAAAGAALGAGGGVPQHLAGRPDVLAERGPLLVDHGGGAPSCPPAAARRPAGPQRKNHPEPAGNREGNSERQTSRHPTVEAKPKRWAWKRRASLSVLIQLILPRYYVGVNHA